MSPGSVERIRLFIEDLAGRFFASGRNPFYFLGALSFFFFWIVLGSGAYLFIVYRLNIDGAYESVQYLTERQPYWGGIIRSLHRYATDGLMITMVLHGLRVFLADQYRGARWVAWVTGVVALGFIWGEGILGYWMVWDDRAQFVALKTSEFLDVLPIIGPSLPRAFLSRDLVTNLFFLVIIALHIALPILMLILLWLHVSRITRPVIHPPRGIMLGAFSGLMVLSLLDPAVSGQRADVSRLPVSLPIDWFYLGPYPVLNSIPPGLSWLLLLTVATLLIAVPWLGRSPRPQPVSVLLRRCNECNLCYQDCPYEAITMGPRTDGRPYAREAVVDADLCVSCGICVGSCTTSALILPGYSLPGLGTGIKKRLLRRAAAGTGSSVVVFLCERSIPAEVIRNKAPWIEPIALPCIGMIHPLLIEHAFKSGASGVFLAACPEGDCHDRFGDLWLRERLAGQREPSLKPTVDLSRIRIAGFSAVRAEEMTDEIERFRSELRGSPPALPVVRPSRWVQRIAAGVILALPALLIFVFSGHPSYSFYGKDESLLVVSLRYTAAPKHCRERTREELERFPEHMRAPLDCTRERWPVQVRLDIDGGNRLNKEYRPTGLWSDGPTYVYEKYRLAPGLHEVRLTLEETAAGFRAEHKKRIEFQPGRAVIFEK